MNITVARLITNLVTW